MLFLCLLQMREQFDSGEKAQFSADDNPHDVAALFKEYFRDLPEPLMTRELYAAFLETQGNSYYATINVNPEGGRVGNFTVISVVVVCNLCFQPWGNLMA